VSIKVEIEQIKGVKDQQIEETTSALRESGLADQIELKD
jgi:hypothetical protein